MYEDTWFMTKTVCGITARVPLTGATKQRNYAGPTVLQIVYNVFLRMIATSRHAVTTEGVDNHNTGGYADYSAITVSSTDDNHESHPEKRLGPIFRIDRCESNIARIEISGLDYNT